MLNELRKREPGASKEMERQGVFGFEDRVAFQLAAPMAIWRLDRQEIALRCLNGIANGGASSAGGAIRP
jgi:hypothetical protein